MKNLQLRSVLEFDAVGVESSFPLIQNEAITISGQDSHNTVPAFPINHTLSWYTTSAIHWHQRSGRVLIEIPLRNA